LRIKEKVEGEGGKKERKGDDEGEERRK